MSVNNISSQEAGNLLLNLFKDHLRKELRRKIMEEIDPIIDERIEQVVKELNAEVCNSLDAERGGLCVHLITHHKQIHEHHVMKRS